MSRIVVMGSGETAPTMVMLEVGGVTLTTAYPGSIDYAMPNDGTGILVD